MKTTRMLEIYGSFSWLNSAKEDSFTCLMIVEEIALITVIHITMLHSEIIRNR
jgi:hypothetical protein